MLNHSISRRRLLPTPFYSQRTFRPQRTFRRFISFLLIFLQIVPPALFAQSIQPDQAVVGQRPIVNVSGNGVPIVQITPPSPAGVSRNRFADYNVGQPGLILNNSGGQTQTQLGGWIQGNPMLGNQSARTILNEVTGALPSNLLGYTEVAGRPANLIVANPNGITCDGCGFIHIPRITLTTGRAQFGTDGAIVGFDVRAGQIGIFGAGLNARDADQLDLITRALKINAAIWANRLEIVTGANHVNYSTGATGATNQATSQTGEGEAPEFSIDVYQLGSMYANAIRMIGTEKGVGVNSAGMMASLIGDITLDSAGEVRITGGQIQSKSGIEMKSDNGISNAGVIYAEGRVDLKTGGLFDNSDLIVSGNDVRVEAAAILNSSVMASGMNDKGEIAIAGNLTLIAKGELQSSGKILSGQDILLQSDVANMDKGLVSAGRDLTLTINRQVTNNAGTLMGESVSIVSTEIQNVGGMIQGGRLLFSTGKIDNTGGRMIQTGAENWVLSADQGIINQDGQILTNAESLTLIGERLDNRSGTIMHAGAGALTINVADLFTNEQGTTTSNGALTMNANALGNKGGVISAAGDGEMVLTIVGLLDNTDWGRIGSGGHLVLNAQTLDNHSGIITSGKSLMATTTGTLTNTSGTMAATENMTLTTGAVNNVEGTIGAVDGSLKMTASGLIDNTTGQIYATREVTVVSDGLMVSEGAITGQNVKIDTRLKALENHGGLIRAIKNLDIQSGLLINDAGLIQADGVMTIDTQGQTLTNSHSGLDAAGFSIWGEFGIGATWETSGIIGKEWVILKTGALHNVSGYIGGKGMDITGTDIHNDQDSVILSETDLVVHGQSFGNKGQIYGSGDLTVDLGQTGFLDNSGLIASNETLMVHAGTIFNNKINDRSPEMTARHVDLTAKIFENHEGWMTAHESLTLTGAGDGQQLDNTGGVLASQASLNLTVTDIIHSGFYDVVAGKHLEVKTASLTGGGRFVSMDKITMNTTGDYTHTNEMRAAGDFIFSAMGDVHNVGFMGAEGKLLFTAPNLMNGNGGVIKATDAVFDISGTLTNGEKGLVDGVNVVLHGEEIHNTGAIYGNKIATEVLRITNISTGVMAARLQMDLGVGELINQDGAILLSLGNMNIGGSLDGSRVAIGTANRISNLSGTIDVWGDLKITTKSLLNKNVPFRTGISEVVGREEYRAYQGSASLTRYDASEVRLMGGYYYENTIGDLPGHGGEYDDVSLLVFSDNTWTDNYYELIYKKTMRGTLVLESEPAEILVGGNLSLFGEGDIINDRSRIVVGGAMTGRVDAVSNLDQEIKYEREDNGSAYYWWSEWHGGFKQERDQHIDGPTVYDPAPVPESYIVGEITKGPTVLKNLAALDLPSIAGEIVWSAGSAPSVTPVPSLRRVENIVIEVASKIAPLVEGSGGDAVPIVVRTAALPLLIPNNNLYQVHPEAAHEYLIETDPRFANFDLWASSNLLLKELEIAPTDLTLKRIGDGFYEQELIRQQIIQGTGQMFLGDYTNNNEQYIALMTAGVTFAKQFNMNIGTALSAELMAQLTSDIVWLVEREVMLADGSRQSVLAPQVYMRVREGDLMPNGALIAARQIDLDITNDFENNGVFYGRDQMLVSANNIHNLGGRIQGSLVDLNSVRNIENLSGLIRGNTVRLAAGNELIIKTQTSTSTGLSGTRVNLGRIAAIEAGNLTATSGGDTTLEGAKIEVTGDALFGADGNININAVRTGSEEHLVWDEKNQLHTSATNWWVTDISIDGNLTMGSGGGIYSQAADITVAGDATLHAVRDIVLDTVHNSGSLDAQHASSETDVFGDKTTETTTTIVERETVRGQFDIENDFVMTSELGDITLNPVNIESGGITEIESKEGQVFFLTDKDSAFKQETKDVVGDFLFSNSDSGYSNETIVHSDMQAASLSVTAKEGVVVEYKAGGSAEESLKTLSKEPGLAWMGELANRTDIDWKGVEEAHQDWDYASQGLTGPAAALLTIAVIVATGGAAAGAAG
ncbi:MAG: filamentous hemagglutinin N-terminal domain-containing protein, partial [Nitrospirota bacterium]